MQIPSEDKEKTAMKVIVTGKDEKVVGIHVIGMGADEMMQGFGVAMKARAVDFPSRNEPLFKGKPANDKQTKNPSRMSALNCMQQERTAKQQNDSGNNKVSSSFVHYISPPFPPPPTPLLLLLSLSPSSNIRPLFHPPPPPIPAIPALAHASFLIKSRDSCRWVAPRQT